jgi:hypothetical protein
MPRFLITLKVRPSRAFAAVAPRQTTTRGPTMASSASSHGRQARISAAFGVLWIRRLAFASFAHLKCFTAFVT